MKIFPIKVNKKDSQELQNLAFRYGFYWNDGAKIHRFPTNEQFYVLVVDFEKKMISPKPWFRDEMVYVLPGESGISAQKIYDEAENLYRNILPNLTGESKEKMLVKIKNLISRFKAQEMRVKILDRLSKMFQRFSNKTDDDEPEFGSRRLPKLSPNPKYAPIYRKPYERKTKDILDNMEFFDDLEIVEME